MPRPGVCIATLARAGGRKTPRGGRGPRGVLAALVLLVGACGKDPILAAAEREEAARAQQAGGAPNPQDRPPDAPVAAPEDPPLAEGTARRIPSRYFPDGTAGTGAGIPSTPAPGVPGVPPPGSPGTPPPGSPGAPSPVSAQPLGPGVPTPPTPVKPADPPPGRPSEPAPGGAGAAFQGPSVVVRGRVVYTAWTKGQVRVTAFDADHQAHPTTPPQVVGAVSLERPGAYELRVPAGKGKVYVEATVDEDGDGRPGRLEPVGTPSRYPVTIGQEAVEGLDIDVAAVAPPPGTGR